MTESPTESLESLVSQYEAGVSSSEGDATTWLAARSAIEARFDELTPEQIGRIETLDTELIKNAGQVASRLAATGTPLSALRNTNAYPPEQWWWYLDVTSHVSDAVVLPPAKAESSLFSRIITVVELVVLAIAIFLLASRFLPQAAPSSTTSNATAFPSWTPAPTATTDAAAFDLTSATVYKAPSDVLEVKLPKGWTPSPATTPGRYSFSYGADPSAAVTLQVIISDAKLLYTTVLGLPTAADSPQAGLEALKKNSPAGGGLTFGDVKPVKIGTLDGYGVPVSVAATQQGPAAELDLRLAALKDGSLVFVVMQGGASVWPMAQPTLNGMADSLVINPGNVPTATPTNTPHPLELTATSIANLQATNAAQIQALTPTSTPISTEAATDAATEANSVATMPASPDASVATSAAVAPASAATMAATP
ncbi:MAG: hypothetical protein ABI947_25725 [Chloroflexota bacterium]